MGAAAYYSKDGGSAQFPLCGLGLFFSLAYLFTRKASVIFWMGRESIGTIKGGLSEASSLIRAVRAAQQKLSDADEPTELAS